MKDLDEKLQTQVALRLNLLHLDCAELPRFKHPSPDSVVFGPLMANGVYS